MEEEKGERGEGKQRAPEENNRNDLTERRRRFVMKLLQISSSTFLILHHFSAFYFQLHVVTTFCVWSGSVYAQKPLKKRSCLVGSVDENTTGKCPDASLTDWIFLRTFADIFLCRQNVFKEHCGHFQLFSRLFLTGSWIVSIRDWFHDPHTLHILTFVSDILPIQLVNCDFVVQFWSCDVYFLSPLRPLLQFFLPPVEGLRTEDVVHCKAHWGDVIVIFGCVNKMW